MGTGPTQKTWSTFFCEVRCLACAKVVPVNFRGIKVGAVNAGKLGFAANFDTAAAAHAGSVNHDGVEGGNDGRVVLLGRER